MLHSVNEILVVNVSRVRSCVLSARFSEAIQLLGRIPVLPCLLSRVPMEEGMREESPQTSPKTLLHWISAQVQFTCDITLSCHDLIPAPMITSLASVLPTYTTYCTVQGFHSHGKVMENGQNE